MGARALYVLMWKHGMVRLRRFIHTTVELVYPILFFLLLFSFKDKFFPKPGAGQKFNQEVDETDSYTLKHAPWRVLYYPNTPATESLMNLVGEQLHLQKLSYSPDPNDNRAVGYYPLSNESEALNYNHLQHDAVIIFRDMEEAILPEKLNYVIRMRDTFNTNGYLPQDLTVGTHSQYGVVYEKFLRLQWAIDTSFIKLQTNKEVPQKLTLQEFPYLRQNGNNSIGTVCAVVQILCYLSLFIAFVFLMSRLLNERTTGIQELIKMVGVSVSTLGFSHFLNALPPGIVFSVVGAVLLKATSNPLLPNSNGFLIFVLLLLYYISIVAMAFACSHLARSAQYGITLAVFAYIASQLPRWILRNYQLSPLVVPLTGFLPHQPLDWFWTEVATLEQYGHGVDFSTMWSSHKGQACAVVVSYLFLLVQSALFFFLAWYLSLVRPGQYGSPLPWNFLCQYWTKNEVKPQMLSEEEVELSFARDPKYFENAPRDMEVGIRISNVTKAFPKHLALSNVSLDVYKGEITVLLGHNGAGKTTLMSIITGMLTATEGAVFVNGMDTATQLAAVRRHLGLCPQHNLFFPDLTVHEHIMFFTLLKHSTYSEARKSSKALAEQLGIRDKAGVLCRELSGGMKRRVQLACALAGGADTLILDEPTSGLDVETRRELWNLLLSLRGSRTVLLTTHFMEEADALGDRVAALHAGRLTCHATTMHLKKAIGTGYRLSLTTTGAPLESKITAVVTSHVKDAAVKEQTINSISYTLPSAASKKFSKLFTELESMRPDLGIDTIGVGVSTLEEVFLKLCSDVDTNMYDEETETTGSDPNFKRSTGAKLYAQQLLALLKRQVKYIMYRKWAFLVLQVILPILMICVSTNLCNHMPDPDTNERLSLELEMYRDQPDHRVLYHVTTDYPIDKLSGRHPDFKFEKADDFDDVVIQAAKEDIFEYNKYIAGIELNDTDAVVRYTTTVRHAVPVGLNLLTNLLAATYIPGADGLTFRTANHPIPMEGPLTAEDKPQPKGYAAFIWVFIVSFIVLTTHINQSSLACRERVSGTRHIHLMAGCAPELLWGAALLWHAAIAAVTLILPVVVATYALEKDHTLDQTDFLGTVAVILLLGSLSFFATMYLVSFHCSERVCSIVLITSCVLFGVLTPVTKTLMDLESPDSAESRGLLYYVGAISGYVAPPHAMVSAMIKAALGARNNANCNLNRDSCPHLASADFDVPKCCAGENPDCYFCLEKNAPGKDLIILAVQFVVYMMLVVLTERGLFSLLCDRVCNAYYRSAPPSVASDTVRAEQVYVEKAITMPKHQIGCCDAMLVNRVHKRYGCIPLLHKPVAAVQGISFSVKPGECFGLLGVNGAGKSTTFKMLTAEVCPTRGNIFANGYHMGLCNSAYLQTLGYCPQFFGLDNFMTGKNNLSLILTLRGYTGDEVKEETKNWIRVVGLEKYQNRPVEQYSGGCVRRLGAAAALCSGASLTMLDEPTAGVDVSARRRVWAALRRGLRHRRAVIITSHSMDEMEALCGRIAIMSAGRVVALGSAAELRASHAAGHAVVLKIRHQHGDEVDGGDVETKRLKEKFLGMFTCELKDEHRTMLHYHINTTMRYSQLFKQLETLKHDFPTLIEDYSVTETTLEEVFLSFAKHGHQGAI